MKYFAYLLMFLLGGGVHGASQSTPGPSQKQDASQNRAAQARRGAEPQRVRLAPQFRPGLMLRYQTEFRTSTDSRRTGVVEDPQAPTQLEITWGAVVRLEVLSVEPDAVGHPAGRTRLRTTYEKSVATTRSDTYDPEGAAMEEQYRKLEGKTVEFTLNADGTVSDVQGLQGIIADERAASTAREWLAQLATGASLPKEGIVPGQKWSSEQPAKAAPLAGMVVRTESTYLRDERCRPAPVAGAISSHAQPEETCAVILTRFEMTQPRALRDATPEDYRKSGLHTAGKWLGTGESLTYVSLRTGWVVSITQSGTEEMDVTVSTANGQSAVRYAGHVRSQSQVTLLP